MPPRRRRSPGGINSPNGGWIGDTPTPTEGLGNAGPMARHTSGRTVAASIEGGRALAIVAEFKNAVASQAKERFRPRETRGITYRVSPRNSHAQHWNPYRM